MLYHYFHDDHILYHVMLLVGLLIKIVTVVVTIKTDLVAAFFLNKKFNCLIVQIPNGKTKFILTE